MQYRKITAGFVIQVYEGTKCVSQEFVAGEVEYEVDTGNGSSIPCDPLEGEEYRPFEMVQPGETEEDYEALEEWTVRQGIDNEKLDGLVHDIALHEAAATNNTNSLHCETQRRH